MNKIRLYVLLQKLLSISYSAIACLGLLFVLNTISSYFTTFIYVLWAVVLAILVFFIFQTKKIFSGNWAKETLHRKNKSLEFSLDLALEKPKNWIEKQQSEHLHKQKIALDLVPNLKYAILGLSALLLASFMPKKLNTNNSSETIIKDTPNMVPIKIPFKFGQISLFVSPPTYTGIPAKYARSLDIEAAQNSELRWEIPRLNTQEVVFYINLGKNKKQKFVQKKGQWTHTDRLISNGLYSIQAYTLKDSLVYQSPFYSVSFIPDLEPKITPSQTDLYANYSPAMSGRLQLNANIKDDYAVQKVQIIATLARGNGENVKFREKIISISTEKFKEKNIKYTLDITDFKFEPGDELFYYWLAADNKWPEPNITKSETYFLKYPNPKETEAENVSTMAMQTLPEYFRSQRQIIIDTEKLVKKRGKIKKQLFDEESNNIGFDQKSLRIRYGQYLGEEYETNLGHAEGSDNPLASFTHDHDAGEHEDHEAHENHSDEQTLESKTGNLDPLAALMEQYVHSHDDTETNTFYEQSTRSLLKMALEQMWQSELQLRLYEPEKALPFENKALEYLKEAQQKARNYVKKSGFEPTPIKEKEKRLTGKLEKTNPNLSFVRFLANEEIKYLCGFTLGLIEKTALSTFEKQNLANLIQILPAKTRIKTDLQKLLNGGILNEIAKNKVKNGLLNYMSYQKGNNALPALAKKNTTLRNEFLNLLRK